MFESLAISIRVVQDTLGRLTVSACTTHLLRVVLQGFGDRCVHHEADIGFIDAHSEGYRRYDDVDLVSHPLLLNVSAGCIRHLRMVKITFNFVLRQLRRQLLTLVTRHAVNDAGLVQEPIPYMDYDVFGEVLYFGFVAYFVK